MNTNDRRVGRTRRLLADALISLILEKGYDAITVQDITDRADVGRATFYRHYRDKDELLTAKLEKVIDELDALTREPSLQDAEGYLIFKHAEENSSLYHILLISHAATRVRRRIEQTIAANMLKTCQPLHSAKTSIIPPEIAANHMAGSLLLLIEWWLECDIPYPAHQMAKIYDRLIINATLSTIQPDR